jgi:hypothetical protein
MREPEIDRNVKGYVIAEKVEELRRLSSWFTRVLFKVDDKER